MRSSRLPINGHTLLETRDLDTAEADPEPVLPARCACAPSIPRQFWTPGSTRSTWARRPSARSASGHEVSIRTEEAGASTSTSRSPGQSVSGPGTADPVVTKPGSAQVFMPGERADLRWSAGTRQLCVMVQRTCLERHLDDVAGCRPQPAGDVPVRHGSAQPGQRYLAARGSNSSSTNCVAPTGCSSTDTMRRTLERLLIESLLLGHQHNYSRGSCGVRRSRAAPGAIADGGRPARDPTRTALDRRRLGGRR